MEELNSCCRETQSNKDGTAQRVEREVYKEAYRHNKKRNVAAKVRKRGAEERRYREKREKDIQREGG